MNKRQRAVQILKNNFALVLIGLFIGIGAVACSGGPRVKMAPGYATTPTRQDMEVNLMGTPEATAILPTPTPEPLQLDDTLYDLPSKALSLNIPQGWKKADENATYVRFEALDRKAWLEAAVESTGYQLSQEDFETYVTSMMTSLYSGVEEYESLDSDVDEGQVIYTSTIRKDGVQWFTYDVFIQRSYAIYSLSFQAYELVWQAYAPGFEAVVDSLEPRTGYVTDEMIYRFVRPYVSPNSQFILGEVPMGWTFGIGQEDLIAGAVVDIIDSPDGQATVEIISYPDESGQDIGITAIGMMKELDGQNIRIRANEVLRDGRVRSDWQNDSDGTRGFSFFWQDNSVVYVLTFKYRDEDTGAYQQVSYNIGDTFSFEVN
jgi:hypothetical protein